MILASSFIMLIYKILGPTGRQLRCRSGFAAAGQATSDNGQPDHRMRLTVDYPNCKTTSRHSLSMEAKINQC